jgi:Protein of unknown function (DUF3108)
MFIYSSDMTYRIFAISVINLLYLCSQPLAAAIPAITSPQSQETSIYTIDYLGLDMGDIELRWEENATHYKISATIVTTGLAKLFSKQTRSVVLYGKKQAGALIPLQYEAKVTYPSKEKTLSFAFSQGHITAYRSTPKNDTVLTSQQQYDAQDPLSALVQLTQFAKTRQRSTAFFSATLFDGKRLNRVYALPTTAKTPCDAGACSHYLLYRKPLAGYSAEKLARYEQGEPPALLTVMEDSHFPHLLEMDTTLSTVSIIKVGNKLP